MQDIALTTTATFAAATVGGELAPAGDRYALPISKLRGLTAQARTALKQRRVTTCSQLLRAAATAEDRAALAAEAGVPDEVLLALVRRADMARVNGIGTVFGMMLEDLGVHDVGALADQDPGALHERLRRYNRQERIARRSPTPEEVEAWVRQARGLPVLVTY
jgi:predicted flap endonuclease-1-like 5' DNA nuclease